MGERLAIGEVLFEALCPPATPAERFGLIYSRLPEITHTRFSLLLVLLP